jgi:hypothetical protein
MFAFFNLGAQELVILLGLGVVGVVVVGVVILASSRGKDRDD